MAKADFSDLTLDELRVALAPAIATSAIFDGWTQEAVENAAQAEGCNPLVAHTAFAEGPMQMVEAWIASVDARMMAEMSRDELASLPIRERIRRLIQFRLDAIGGHEEALRSASAIMARPSHAKAALKLGWHSADLMWRMAGDTATDWNYYSKRTILAGVYASTLAVFSDDKSAGKEETKAFLDRRIAGIIRFEKAKAKVLKPSVAHFSMARFLGRLRYPAS